MKNMNQDMASSGRAAEGNFRQREIRRPGAIEVFFIKSFPSCKDLLPKKRDFSMVLPDFRYLILCNPLRKTIGIFGQALPIEMKNKSKHEQRRADGKKGNFRQRESYGQKGRRRFCPSNHFPQVRIYYRKNALYQGFRPDLPVKLCSMIEQGRRNFLPNLSIDDE